MPKFLYQINYFNAIVCCLDAEKWSFKKYHNIRNTDKHLSNFLAFAKDKFPGAQYVNFYNKDTKRFYERIYLE